MKSAPGFYYIPNEAFNVNNDASKSEDNSLNLDLDERA